MKTVLFILLDRYADWEAAPLASVINRQPGWRVQTVSPAGSPVRSLGGFTTVPEGAVPAQLPPDGARRRPARRRLRSVMRRRAAL